MMSESGDNQQVQIAKYQAYITHTLESDKSLLTCCVAALGFTASVLIFYGVKDPLLLCFFIVAGFLFITCMISLLFTMRKSAEYILSDSEQLTPFLKFLDKLNAALFSTGIILTILGAFYYCISNISIKQKEKVVDEERLVYILTNDGCKPYESKDSDQIFNTRYQVKEIMMSNSDNRSKLVYTKDSAAEANKILAEAKPVKIEESAAGANSIFNKKNTSENSKK